MARVNREYESFNCYKILGIPPSASPSEIKSARRKMSMLNHPDKGGSEEKQKHINLAYEVLRDPFKRQSHDVFWNIHKSQKTHSNANSQTHKTQQQQSKPNNNSSHYQHADGQPLSAFRVRLQKAINAKKSEIWGTQNKREEEKYKDYQKRVESEKKAYRSMALWTIGLGITSIYLPLLWVLTAIVGYNAFIKPKEVKADGKSFALSDAKLDSLLKEHAKHSASEACFKEAKDAEEYESYFSSLFGTIIRPSSFDDSEEQVARRLTVAFFLMGYIPISYHAEERILVFQDDDEKLAVRFRHRSGNALNITYVEKLRYIMMATKSSQGFIFCSPGLSGNAATFASKNGIKYHTLESMNAWINSIAKASYAGPRGDILKNLQHLSKFMSQISPQVGYSRSYRRRPSRRRYY